MYYDFPVWKLTEKNASINVNKNWKKNKEKGKKRKEKKKKNKRKRDRKTKPFFMKWPIVIIRKKGRRDGK